MDKRRIQQRFSRAFAHYDQQALAQQRIHQRLTALLPLMERRDFQHILEIGCGTGGLTRQLMRHLNAQRWTLNDLCDIAPHLTQVLPQSFRFYAGDAERLPWPEQYDLIAGASVVQWFADPAGFIARCQVRLKKRGFLLLSTFGAENLSEIRQLTGVGLNYPSPAQWRRWLSAGFELLSLEQENIVLHFDSPLAVLRHLKHTGVTATGRQAWTKGGLQHFCRQYQRQFASAHDQVRLTYAPVYLLARSA